MELKCSEKIILDALSASIRGRMVSFDHEISESDWRMFFRLANEQKILALVFDPVRDYITGSATDIVEITRSTVIRQVSAQTVKTAEFLKLYSFMTDKGLRPIVVKGIVCRSIYPLPDCRISRDEDIFVRDSEWDDAVSLLREYGMTAEENDGHNSYEISFRNADLTVELHRTLFSDSIPAFEGFNSFFENSFDEFAEYPASSGKNVLSLSPHGHLLFLILHAYKHFIRSGFGIRQICDIGLWAEKYADLIDWENLYCQLESVCATTFFASILKIARDHLQIDIVIPEIFGLDIDTIPMLCDVFAGGIYGGKDPRRKNSGFGTLNAVSSDRNNKRASVFTLLFPPRAIMENNYPELKKHPSRLPITWMKRIVKYLKRKKEKKNTVSGELIETINDRTNLLRYYGIIQNK